MDANERESFLFINLLFSLQMTAMQQMGKIKNPATDSIERDLDGAQTTIDILEALHKKTKNNLDDQEEKFLTIVLQELKLNFVDEKNKG
ncbi:MAG: DUF1844 domain-containing protein [Bacteroidota bacterium]